MSKYFWFVFLCLALACKQEKQTKISPPLPLPALSDTETAALYKFYKSDPSTTEEKDENALIEYAVNHKLKVTRSPSGLYYYITKKGNGSRLNGSETLKVDYRGYFLSGEEFDSSYGRGRPISFSIGQMIEGWNEGLTYLNHGDEAIFLIPSYLAYGSRGSHGLVPADTPLIFELHVH